MCNLEHTYYILCHHWGRNRFVGEPCIRSRYMGSTPLGCSYQEIIGMVNLCSLCPRCAAGNARLAKCNESMIQGILEGDQLSLAAVRPRSDSVFSLVPELFHGAWSARRDSGYASISEDSEAQRQANVDCRITETGDQRCKNK
jgi:hypothetical protein